MTAPRPPRAGRTPDVWYIGLQAFCRGRAHYRANAGRSGPNARPAVSHIPDGVRSMTPTISVQQAACSEAWPRPRETPARVHARL